MGGGDKVEEMGRHNLALDVINLHLPIVASIYFVCKLSTFQYATLQLLNIKRTKYSLVADMKAPKALVISALALVNTCKKRRWAK